MVIFRSKMGIIGNTNVWGTIFSLIQQIILRSAQMWRRSASKRPGSQTRGLSRSYVRSTQAQVTTEAPIRVFVVDDHPAVLEGISRLLESEPGTTVVGVAENAEDCFKMLGNQAVDVVVMDINLPGLDGIQATRQIKAKQQDLKIIILSSFGREYLDKAVEAGVDGYLLKTSGKIELVNAVVQAVSDCAPIIDSKLTMCLLDRLGGPERRECEQG